MCHSPNPPENLFCGHCGTSLVSPPVPERRQLTVLFCDLVDSAPLSEPSAPEKLHDVIHTYQNACTDVVKRFEGHVGQSLDDGLFAYFGYPSAHEDDPQRAVRAGLAIIQKIRDLSATLQLSLQVRIGLHTGPVVTGESSGNSIAIAGGTPDIASRLPGNAKPNTLLRKHT